MIKLVDSRPTPSRYGCAVFVLAISLIAVDTAPAQMTQRPDASKETPQQRFERFLQSMSLTKGRPKSGQTVAEPPGDSEPKSSESATDATSTDRQQSNRRDANQDSAEQPASGPPASIQAPPGQPGANSGAPDGWRPTLNPFDVGLGDLDQRGRPGFGSAGLGLSGRGAPGLNASPEKLPGNGNSDSQRTDDGDSAGTQRGSSSAISGRSVKAGDGENRSADDAGSGADGGSSQEKRSALPQDKFGANAPGMPPLGSVDNLSDQFRNAAEIAERAAEMRASAAGGNAPFDPDGLSGTFADLFDSVHAGAGVGPGLRWRVVKPAGTAPEPRPAAVSLEGGQTDDSDVGRQTFTLDVGTLRSELVTGPENPLLVPPDVASSVFVIDISGSMAGSRFRRVAAALSDAVMQMDENQQFALLLFNNLALQLDDGGLMQATAANKQLVADQLSQVRPVGGTDPTDALLVALQIKPESIVVFSDGEFEESIVHRVTRLNRTSGHNIRINGVGISSHVSMLKLLTRLNGPGTYLEVP